MKLFGIILGSAIGGVIIFFCLLGICKKEESSNEVGN